MLNLIFISPLLIVAVGAVLVRYVIRKKPLSWMGWTCLVVFMGGAILLPLTQGVWIADLTGVPRTLGRADAANGDRFEVVQYWNHIDFYTTEVQVTRSDGTTSVVIIDGDANRSRDATITLDETSHIVMVEVDGMGYPAFEW